MIPFTAPSFNTSEFNCPHCNAYSHQDWYSSYYIPYGSAIKIKALMVAFCTHCKKYSIWKDEKIIYPEQTEISQPNPDLNEDIQEDYIEASTIVNKSPRGATALLRLCIQKLCIQLGESGKNINTDIANLVKKGLPTTIQKALDIVRVIGNNAVHPGQIHLKDNKEIANKLFDLINIISQLMITQPKEIEKLYNSLPKTQLEAIEKRDSNN